VNLNEMAMRGGEPRSGGPPFFYPVNSQSDFENAIGSIAAGIISCNFDLTMRPPDPDLVTITANGQTVPRDPMHMNGWDFGASMMSIQFYGSYCQNLRTGMITEVRAVFGCPPVAIHR